MRIHDPVRVDNRIEYQATWDAGGTAVYIDVPANLEASMGGDAMLSSSLLPAMSLGDTELEIDAAVDERLLDAAGSIQDLLLSWDLSLRPKQARYQRTRVLAGSNQPRRRKSSNRRTACFFTGGVDSFYSVVKNHADLSALIFVHGFDIPVENVHLFELVVEQLRDASAMLELPLIEVTTNLRQLERMCAVGWTDYHGPALATIAHVLAPSFDRVLVPSSWGYAHLKPWGSHPLLDPLWSSNELEIVHDGAETNRLGKMRRIAKCEAAQKFLRVCYENPDNAYNCGVCDKCIRTGTAAVIAGIQADFATLPAPEPSQIARLRVTDGSEVTWQDYHDDLTRSGNRPDIRRAIGLALARQRLTGSASGRFVRRQRARAIWAKAHPSEALHRILRRGQ